MTTNVSSKPRADMWGVDDESTRQLVLEEVSIPQHCPLSYTFAAWGTEEPTLFLGGGLVKMYGAETFSETSRFTTHQTPFINVFKKNANAQMMRRLTPPNAKTAMLRLSLELIKTEVSQYARNADGSFKYVNDAFNQRVRVVDETFVGYRVIPHLGVEHYREDDVALNPINHRAFGMADIVRDFRVNTTRGSDGSQLGQIEGQDTEWSSTLYPILDLPLAYKGSRGDDFGLRMGFPTSKGSNPIDTASVYSTMSYLLRLGVVERNKVTGGFDIVNTAAGEVAIDVSLKQNVSSERGVNLDIESAFIPAYKVPSTATQPEYPGPFGDIYIYRDSLEEVQKALIVGPDDANGRGEEYYNEQAKLDFGRVPVTVDNSYLLNMFTGYDVDAVPYYAFETGSGALFGGVTLTADSILYATGGDDGLIMTAVGEADSLANLELFDALVRTELNSFDNGTYNWLNTARYPISAIWDSGFSMETKKSMLNIIGTRKDTMAYLATQSQADYVSKNVGGVVSKVWSWVNPNTEAEETSIASTLRAIASGYPESDVYGTPVCRAVIVGQCGTIVNSSYKRSLPLTYELADKVSKFMGSTDGIWRDADAYDQNPNNVIALMENINLTWKNENVGRQAWANGLTYAEDFDIRSQFFPAVRTVYTNETSVLTSAITTAAICYVQRVQQISWRYFTGNGKFRKQKFAELVDEFIRERLAGRFDDRFTFEVRTEFTQADEAAGYSWTTHVTIYAPNMVTVGKYSIVSRRISDLEEADA